MGNLFRRGEKCRLDILGEVIEPASQSHDVSTKATQSLDFNPTIKPVMSSVFKPPGKNEDWEYPFSHRRMPYRREKYEVSKEESERIEFLLENQVKGFEEKKGGNEQKHKRRKLIIDTDIGTDVDDVLAVLMTLQLPPEDVELLAITTNYFPTKVRAKVATSLVSSFNACSETKIFPDIAAGTDYLCGTHRRVLECGNEGKGLVPELSKEEQKKLREPVEDDNTDAVDLILSVLRKYPGEVTIVSIGIPTNLARCVVADPNFATLVDRVFVMGGGSAVCTTHLDKLTEKPLFELSDNEEEAFTAAKKDFKPMLLFPNHNISGDTAASKVLFESGCSIYVISHATTAQFWLEGESIETLLQASKQPKVYPAHIHLGGRLVVEWFKRRFGQRGQCPHDPLTVFEAIYCQDQFAPTEKFEQKSSILEYVRGDFVCHEWASYLTFVPSLKGKHFLAANVYHSNSWLNWLHSTLIKTVPQHLVVEQSSVS